MQVVFKNSYLHLIELVIRHKLWPASIMNFTKSQGDKSLKTCKSNLDGIFQKYSRYQITTAIQFISDIYCDIKPLEALTNVSQQVNNKD